jgi:hypothetical protein
MNTQTKFSPDLPDPLRPAPSHPRAPNANARTPVAPALTRSEEELTRSALARHAEAINGLALELRVMFPVACELLAELKRRTEAGL